VKQKTVLLVDDEQGFLEPLVDALHHEGYRVLTAATAADAIALVRREKVDLATVDVMLTPGDGLGETTDSHRAGVYLMGRLVREAPSIHLFALSVVNDPALIKEIQRLGVRFLRKGETPLRTVLDMIRSRLTGLAYSSERDERWRDS